MKMPNKKEMKGIEFQPVKYKSDFVVTLPKTQARALVRGINVPIYVTTVDPDDKKRKIRYNFGLGKVGDIHAEEVDISLDRRIGKDYVMHVGIPNKGKRFMTLTGRNKARVKNAIQRALGLKIEK